MSDKLDFLFLLGRPLSPVYAAAMKLRQFLYLRGIFKQHSLPVPVISVGNLVLGGTGKTPTVQYIANLLLSRGFNPAVVSRGYGGRARGKHNVVSNGSEILLGPLDSGDEPFMLAESLPGVPVLTGKKRLYPCKYAIETFGADCIILDDGFQHLSVKRDIDIVLFDTTTLAGNSRVFPGGHLREPISALHRCSCFILTGSNALNKTRGDKFATLLCEKFSNKPVYYSSLTEFTFINSNKTEVHSENIGTTFAFCGIANPERFRTTLSDHGITLSGFSPLSDHTPYSSSVVDKLVKKAKKSGAVSLITTEKDAVKLQKHQLNMPLYTLKLRSSISSEFTKRLLQDLSR